MNALVKNQRRSFAVTLLLCAHLFAGAQITANFTATPQSGCSPLIVHFTEISTGNPTQWKWDLGNGAISTLKNPSATYFNPGTYTVRLIAGNGSSSDSVVKTQYITVYANPVARFGASDTTGCFPLMVSFTDSSIAGSGNISSWQWDFGDGSISSLQNPTHTYTAAGNYTVTLKVANSYGCVQSLNKTHFIEVTGGVEAGFTYSANGICSAPATVQFANTSAGPGNLSHYWDFGDGVTSTSADPSHVYTANGTYSVSLITTSAQGCSDTLQMPGLISIGMQNADFSAPLTACVGKPLQLTNTSTPVPMTASWNFGDGSSSVAMNPTKIYSTPGLYTIKLVADFGGCMDSVVRQVNVSATPEASFLADETIFCKLPATAQFNPSTTGVSYKWHFGDGQTSTLANPSHTYTAEGNYSVTLVVTNAAGCSDTLKRANYIQVKEPEIQLAGLPQTGCTPLTANFMANITSSEPVQSWNWNFGDGSTSSAAAPSHTYNNAGNYNITLVITTAGGCKDSVTMVDGVRAGDKPQANFVALPPQVCNMSPVEFMDSSLGNVDQWLWEFGDNMTSTQQNPAHVFGDIGIYTVKLTVWSNTCPDTIEKIDVVRILPPIAGFSVEHSCEEKYTKKFTDASTGATSWLWNFGDGNTSTAQHPVHTYNAPGEYKVILKVSNDSCWNTNFVWVKVVDEQPNLLVNDVICKGSTEVFPVPTVDPANISTWNWDFGDGHTSQQAAPLSHVYESAGFFKVRLTVTDVLGCSTTAIDSIRVYGPTAGFIPGVIATCLNGNQVSFTDTSYGDGQNGLVQWLWNFGDGTFHTSTIASPVSHSYDSAGEYTISLVVKDSYGCKDTADFSPLVIAKPVASFYTPDSLSCTGKTIEFTNQSSGYGLSYYWQFGDGHTSTVAQPQHQYAATGTYKVSLKVTDQYGCSDSLVRIGYITISMPHAAFDLSDSTGSCPPLMVHFTNQSTSYTQFAWDFGDGSFSSLQNPSHYYTTAGTFHARLIVWGPGGCSDTAFRKIVVKGPSGSFTYAPISGCNPLTVGFTLSSQNASSFVWDFSDGNTLPSLTSTASHTYTMPGDYVPKLVLVDTAGCSVPITGPDTIRVYDATAGFTSDLSTVCDAGSVQFTSTSVANDYIAAYYWNFGDGHTSTSSNPVHYYEAVGNYTVQLIVVTANGCSDTAIVPDAIKVLEKPSVEIDGVTEACMPASIQFSGSIVTGDPAALSWAWDFGNGQSGNSQHPGAQQYSQDGSYAVELTATAQNGCRDTAARTVNIHPIPQTNAGADAAICRGSEIQLQATGAATYSWAAVPSLSCTDCASPIASPVEAVTYVVTGTNGFGCSSVDSVAVQVHQPFVLTTGPGDTICTGEKIQLSAAGADQYSWFPSTGLQNPNGAATSAAPSSSVTYYVVGTDNNNCFTDTAFVHVKVWPIPTVSAGADQQLEVGDALVLTANASSDVVAWQWNPAGSLSCATCATTMAKPKHTTNYNVQVKNAGGCTAEDNVTVTVICNNGNLFIPNTFSPNGDGMNDQFFPSGKGINMIKSLRVYNRWGQVVYERMSFSANDASGGWDGTFKGHVLPPDVYVYACEVVCQNNEVLSYKGDVTLLR